MKLERLTPAKEIPDCYKSIKQRQEEALVRLLKNLEFGEQNDQQFHRSYAADCLAYAADHDREALTPEVIGRVIPVLERVSLNDPNQLVRDKATRALEKIRVLSA